MQKKREKRKEVQHIRLWKTPIRFPLEHIGDRESNVRGCFTVLTVF